MASTNDPSDTEAKAAGASGELPFVVGEGLDLSLEPDARLDVVEDRWWDSTAKTDRSMSRNRRIEAESGPEPGFSEMPGLLDSDEGIESAKPVSRSGPPMLPLQDSADGVEATPVQDETQKTELFPWEKLDEPKRAEGPIALENASLEAAPGGVGTSGGMIAKGEGDPVIAEGENRSVFSESLPPFLLSVEAAAVSSEPGERKPENFSTNDLSAADPLDLETLSGKAPIELPDGASTRTKAKAGCWTMFATFFFIVAMLGLAGGAGFLWLKARNFEASITEAARDQMAEHGLFFEYEGWRYRFPRGIVLSNVSVYAQPDPDVVALTASDIGVNVDFWTLLEAGGLDGTAELNFSDTEMVFFDGGQEVARLAGVDAEIFVNPQEILVERFAAGWAGVRLRGSGRVGLLSEGGIDLAETDPAEGTPATAEPAGVFGIPVATLAAIQKVMAVEADGDVPSLDVEFSAESGQSDSLLLAASLTGREFRWHGVSCQSLVAHARYDAADGILDVDSFQSIRGDGQISGTFSYYTTTGEISLTQIQSSVDPLTILSEYDPALAAPYAGITFLQPPTLFLSGTIPLDTPKRSKLTIACQRLAGVTWKQEDRSIMINDLRGTGVLSDGTLEMDEIAASIWGGTALVKGTLRVVEPELPFSGLVEVKGASLATFAASLGSPPEGLNGKLDVNFRGVGYRDPAKIRGGGQVEIRDANLGTFPAVGPVQATLGRIVPALSFTGEGSLRGAYIVEAGVLVTSDLKVENQSAILTLNGSLNLSRQDTDFTALARLQPPLAAATGLVDKTIKVTGSGPLGSPTLKIKEFPLEFAGESLQSVLGTTPETLALLEESFGNAESAAAALSDQLESAVGLELGSEIRDLLNRIVGASEADAASAPPANPAP